MGVPRDLAVLHLRPGRRGGRSATILAAFAVTVIGPTGLPSGYSALLLPLVIVTVSGTSYATARRSAAQRMLLGKQARVLATALDRSRRQEQESPS